MKRLLKSVQDEYNIEEASLCIVISPSSLENIGKMSVANAVGFERCFGFRPPREFDRCVDCIQIFIGTSTGDVAKCNV